MIGWILIGGGVALFLLAVVWPKLKAIVGGLLPAGANTGLDAASGVAAKTADFVTAWSAYGSLTAIRVLDSVEADPKAIEACDYLRNVVTAWKRPTPASSDNAAKGG